MHFCSSPLEISLDLIFVAVAASNALALEAKMDLTKLSKDLLTPRGQNRNLSGSNLLNKPTQGAAKSLRKTASSGDGNNASPPSSPGKTKEKRFTTGEISNSEDIHEDKKSMAQNVLGKWNKVSEENKKLHEKLEKSRHHVRVIGFHVKSIFCQIVLDMGLTLCAHLLFLCSEKCCP